jgi:hypothetical protein
VAADEIAATSAFVTAWVEVAGGCRLEVSAEPTACWDLVIAPSVQTTASRQAAFDGDRLILVQASTGRCVAAAHNPQALHDLARQLAWFDERVIDPGYLTDSANTGVLASIKELFRQWRIDEAQADTRPTFLTRTRHCPHRKLRANLPARCAARRSGCGRYRG